jgi:hypothetical protein
LRFAARMAADRSSRRYFRVGTRSEQGLLI